MPADADVKPCPICGGRGSVALEGSTLKRCPRCAGNGRIEKPFHEKLSQEERQAMGGAGGMLFGAAVGGPVGAVVGGLLGAAIAGNRDGSGRTEVGIE